MPEPDSMYHGLLIIDKPGRPSSFQPTSHDVVAAIRRWSGQRRVGHTGTLDPMASGVLVLCLGRATRLAEYYVGHVKQYWAEVRLGAATDTYDATGEVTERAPVPHLDAPRIEQVLSEFRGETTQTPPIYSAIKQEGQALHRRARRGETVQLAPRPVKFFQLELLEFEYPDTILLRVVCSAGAYIRSLAHDLGTALGSYAHLAGLRREAAGPFTLAQAHTLQAIEEAANAGRFGTLLLPMGTGLDMPCLYPDMESLARLGHGQTVLLRSATHTEHDACLKAGRLAQAIAPDGSLTGIIRCFGPAETAENASLWRAEKWLSVVA